jgi:hypothetical protein
MRCASRFSNAVALDNEKLKGSEEMRLYVILRLSKPLQRLTGSLDSVKESIAIGTLP